MGVVCYGLSFMFYCRCLYLIVVYHADVLCDVDDYACLVVCYEVLWYVFQSFSRAASCFVYGPTKLIADTFFCVDVAPDAVGDIHVGIVCSVRCWRCFSCLSLSILSLLVNCWLRRSVFGFSIIYPLFDWSAFRSWGRCRSPDLYHVWYALSIGFDRTRRVCGYLKGSDCVRQ